MAKNYNDIFTNKAFLKFFKKEFKENFDPEKFEFEEVAKDAKVEAEPKNDNDKQEAEVPVLTEKTESKKSAKPVAKEDDLSARLTQVLEKLVEEKDEKKETYSVLI